MITTKYKMDRSFVRDLRKMTSLKTEEYQDEFFRRAHVINNYMNETGATFNSLNVAANVMLIMDLENIWGEEENT